MMLGFRSAVAAVIVSSSSLVQSPPPLAAALVGSWTGTLEYRDYQTDRRVKLTTD